MDAHQTLFLQGVIRNPKAVMPCRINSQWADNGLTQKAAQVNALLPEIQVCIAKPLNPMI